jgi:hypothetical protein
MIVLNVGDRVKWRGMSLCGVVNDFLFIPNCERTYCSLIQVETEYGMLHEHPHNLEIVA